MPKCCRAIRPTSTNPHFKDVRLLVTTSVTTLRPFPSISYQSCTLPERLHSLISVAILPRPRAGLRQLRAGAVGRSRAPLGPLSHPHAVFLKPVASLPVFPAPGVARERGKSSLPLWGSSGSVPAPLRTYQTIAKFSRPQLAGPRSCAQRRPPADRESSRLSARADSASHGVAPALWAASATGMAVSQQMRGAASGVWRRLLSSLPLLLAAACRQVVAVVGSSSTRFC